MRNLKSHFVFTKEQRHGIFWLLFIIVLLQCIYFFVDFSSDDVVVNPDELKVYEAEIDALRQAKIEKVSHTKTYSNRPKTIAQKTDLNKATVTQLQRVNGIGKTLSERIVKYRESNGGFIADVQLQDVYGLSPEVILKITEHFTVKTPKTISKINLNTASAETLVTIQHIDYEVVYNIIEYRSLHEGFKTLDELLKVKDFPTNKLEIIKLSLHIQ